MIAVFFVVVTIYANRLLLVDVDVTLINIEKKDCYSIYHLLTRANRKRKSFANRSFKWVNVFSGLMLGEKMEVLLSETFCDTERHCGTQ